MNQLLLALRAAGEITRLRILSILRDSELTVSEITQVLGQSQPRVSRHLKLLCDAGLLKRYQEGAWVFHRLSDSGEMDRVARNLIDLIDLDDAEVKDDLSRLNQIKQKNAADAEEYFNHNAHQWDSIRSLIVPDIDIERHMVNSFTDIKIDHFVDLGTGTGRVLEIFAPHIQKGIGIDVSREMLQVARANLHNANITNCQVRHGNILRLNLEAASADVVTLHQVLHYLDDAEPVIAEVSRILRPGGYLLIVDLLTHQMEFLREKHAHRRLGFSDETVKSWCESCGLDLVQSQFLSNEKADSNEVLTVGLWKIVKKDQNN